MRTTRFLAWVPWPLLVACLGLACTPFTHLPADGAAPDGSKDDAPADRLDVGDSGGLIESGALDVASTELGESASAGSQDALDGLDLSGAAGSGGVMGVAGVAGAAGMAGTVGMAGPAGAGGTSGVAGAGGAKGTAGGGGSAGMTGSGGMRGAGTGGMVGSGGATSAAGSGGAAGAPPRPQGSACTADGSCQSGHCVEGVCCDKACTTGCSSCRAANTGVGEGTCAPVKVGVVHGNDCTASAASTCGVDGTCDGNGGCHKWVLGTPCGSAACPTGTSMQLPAPTCNGTGACVTGAGSSCGAYACNSGASSCYTSCTLASQCGASANCNGNTCVTKGGPGQLCSQDSECSSGDCGGRCCTDGSTCSCPQPSPQNLVRNAGFDKNLTGWGLIDLDGGDPATSISWDLADSSMDGRGNLPCPFSGSVHIRNTSAAVRQCVTLDPAKTYYFGHRARAAGNAVATCDFESYASQGCNTLSSLISSSTWINVGWSGSLGGAGSPDTRVSGQASLRVNCYLMALHPTDPPEQEGWIDNVFVSEAPFEF
jgi:hypothetical protein